MSLSTRKELIDHICDRYRQVSRHEKKVILNELMAVTGYKRKYAISLLNQIKITPKPKIKRVRTSKYGEPVREALVTIWYAANRICSKRLVPFLPELLEKMEEKEHLSLSAEVRAHLLKLSAATVDRLLRDKKRQVNPQGINTTRPGSLIKKHIKVRTFADWNEVTPGFMEADLVAHCGDSSEGQFLNTLVLTDIASTWTECLPLLQRGEADVVAAVKTAEQLIPFSFLGLDTDNGGEFINYNLLRFCEERKITFTRSRAYRKNDQAHVEEKNGSIVRKIVGYDRYEGRKAWQALADLYATLRLYINFFQPCVKLISKTRQGARVIKKYDQAQTPYQRLLISSHINDTLKGKLKNQYKALDPVSLLRKVEHLQEGLWQYAWKESKTKDSSLPSILADIKSLSAKKEERGEKRIDSKSLTVVGHYHRTIKPKKFSMPRTWRRRADPFALVREKIHTRLELNPEISATDLLSELMREHPNKFHSKNLRVLQRRVAEWREAQHGYKKSERATVMSNHFCSVAKMREFG